MDDQQEGIEKQVDGPTTLEPDRSTKRWATVGRFAAATGGIATIIALLFGIWTWWASGPRVIVETTWSPMTIPPDLAGVLTRLEDASIYGLRDTRTDTDATPVRSIEAEAVRHFFPRSELAALRELNFVWRIQASNKGRAQAEVSLRVPEVRFALVSREGVPQENYIVRDGTERIDVGVVRPGEAVTVLAWGRSYRTVPPRGDEGVTLYLSEGRGKVLQNGLVGPKVYWLATDFLSITKFGLWFTAIIALIAVLASTLTSLPSASDKAAATATSSEDQQESAEGTSNVSQ